MRTKWKKCIYILALTPLGTDSSSLSDIAQGWLTGDDWCRNWLQLPRKLGEHNETMRKSSGTRTRNFVERNGEFNRGELCTLEEQTIPASCETALSSNKRENEPLCKSVREPVHGADNTFSENLRVTLLPPHSPPVPLLLLLLLLLPSPPLASFSLL